MDSIMKPAAPSEAHPETMDFLSRAWCNFAVQALQPDTQDQSIILLDSPIKKFNCDTNSPPPTKLDRSVKMDDPDFKSLPPWKSNDVKSWIWMQQAMHPELNYNSCFRRKWMQMPWKIVPFKTISIKKWLKEMKLKRKEHDRLQKAEVHAAISVAGVAAALAAIAAENSKKDDPTKEAAVASAAALVAAQCAQMAEAMGAKKEQISGMMDSAMSSTSTSDILTLTAAAATSIRGAATLKARAGCKNMLNGSAPVLPIEDSSTDIDFDFAKCRSILANGSQLHVETPDGNFRVRSVSIVLNNKGKVILKMRKLNLLKSKKESIVLDLHAELYKDLESDQETDTCYLIVLTTNLGIIKLDMGDDHHRYRIWATTINHMLMLSTSFVKYQLQQYHKN
ncbi:hypothetical protein Tsubulata_006239 [Turnera subulata]|uniref:VAN3-binding protein-like auxin canalisation domain-containing protein n=1 Tax=Turnera subulata TaxID=218843 RepID=A0A9Q0J873_9ROSI|nr:hypothetical protein Tsubulata_006239 [Turnera subulata]